MSARILTRFRELRLEFPEAVRSPHEAHRETRDERREEVGSRKQVRLTSRRGLACY